MAVEPELVGALATALDDEVAKSIGLSDEQYLQLAEVVDQRETDALDLVLELRKATPAERTERLAKFRAESEQAGLRILDEAQRDKLLAIHRRRTGDPEPAKPADDSSPMADDREPGDAPSNPPKRDVDSEEGDSEGSDADLPRPAKRKPVAKTPVASDGKLRFNFRYQPWADVLDWFAEQADLSLHLDAPPPGTFNYVDSRGYTPAEAIDLLNSVLLTKGYTLVRRERLLMLVNLADGIPANLVPTVPLEKLDSFGAHELVSVLFPVKKMTPAEAEAEIKKLLGPQGSIVVLAKAQQLQVTETAGRLRTIRSVIEAVEGPADDDGTVKRFALKSITAAEALPVLRKLLNLPEESDAAADGSLRLAADLSGRQLLATGKAHRLEQVEQILATIDVSDGTSGEGDLPAALDTPQLEVYKVTDADPAAVLAVMQTLLAGASDVRLATDPKTGNLVALAKPSQHATIRATLAQMQRDAQRVEAVQLRTVDPQSAVLAINKLFGGGENAGAHAPKVDADPVSRTLLIRGSEAQIEQIRALLTKMGEGAAGEKTASTGGNVRMLPLSGRAARSAIEQVEQLWPTLRKNPIRIVSPSSIGSALRTRAPEKETPDRILPPREDPAPANEDAPNEDQPSEDAVPEESPAEPAPKPRDKSASAPRRVRVQLISHRVDERAQDDDASEPAVDPAIEPAGEPLIERRADVSDAPDADNPHAGAPIVVAPGPQGTIIASEDREALDEFETLLKSVASRTASGREFAVFYLRHAQAAAVAETLRQIFGGGGGSGGGDGGLIGDLAGAALGDLGGGLLGNLLGGGGEGGTKTVVGSGAIDIVPDVRLNALVVQARPADLDTIEQLLEVLDQTSSPEEVQVASRPRLIPVVHTSAEQMAAVVRQVYAEQLAGSGGGAARQPSPEDFIRALRGGRGGRGGGGGGQQAAATEAQKMSLGIDTRSNSLVVSAPAPLFEEVQQLVRQLDQPQTDAGESMRVVTLRRSNPQAVSQALTAILGDQVQTSKTPPAATPGRSESRGGRRRPEGDQSRGQGPQTDPAEAFRQRMEFFDQLRRSREQGGGGGSRRGDGQNRRP